MELEGWAGVVVTWCHDIDKETDVFRTVLCDLIPMVFLHSLYSL